MRINGKRGNLIVKKILSDRIIKKEKMVYYAVPYPDVKAILK
jgi:hypothetical protein